MPQFASTDDLAARLGITLTMDEETRADILLTAASELVQDEAKQTIELVEDDELTIRGTTEERILLPERPVVSVASVTLDGTPLTEGGSWFVDGNELVRAGITMFLTGVSDSLLGYGRGFGFEWQSLEIVYTHGYDPVPGLVKSICLEAVVRVWVNPGAVVEERFGNESTVYAPRSGTAQLSGLLLTDIERSALRRKFGRPAKSITIGGGP